MGYVWQRFNTASSTWVNIPGAIKSTLTLPVTCLDNGTQVRAKVTIPGRMVYSDVVSVEVVPDVVPPAIAYVSGDLHSNIVTVVFAEKVTATSATNVGNYTFSGALSVIRAQLMADQKSVVLTLDGDAPQGLYTVTARNITDLACVPNTTTETTSAPFNTPWPIAYGYVQAQQYLNVIPPEAMNVSWALRFITEAPNYPLSPDLTVYTNITDWPQTDPSPSGIDNYGLRMTGVIIPSVSGNYTFRITADDAARLTVSPYGNTSVGTVLINSEEGGGCSACGGVTSQPYQMTAGYAYTFEALFLEGTGGDYMHLHWLPPGATDYTNIFGTNLAFTVNPDIVNLVTLRQPTNITILEGRDATFVATASASVGVPAYQWQYFDNTNAMDWVDIPGATSPTYKTGYRCEDNNGLKLRAVIGLSLVNGLITRTNITDEVILTVLPDEAPPIITSVGSLDGNTIGVVFSEPIRIDALGFTGFDNWEILDANISANLYFTNADGTCQVDPFTLECIPTYYNYPVSQVLAWPDTNAVYTDKVVLVLDSTANPFVPLPASFNVHCYYAVDTSCRQNSLDSLGDGIPQGLKLVDIGAPEPPGSAFVANSNKVQVAAGGADVWGQGDQFTFLYKQVEGDFDARVSVAGIPDPIAPAPNAWTKAMIMLRGYIEGTDGVLTNSALGDATNSYMAYITATPTNGQRVFASAVRYVNNTMAVDFPGTAYRPQTTFPADIRMVREKDAITTFFWGYQTNIVTDTNTLVTTTNVLGPQWVTYGTVNTTNWANLLYLGLGVTSHVQSNAVKATFESFRMIDRPIITLQPVGTTVQTGESASFTVAGTGPARWRTTSLPMVPKWPCHLRRD